MPANPAYGLFPFYDFFSLPRIRLNENGGPSSANPDVQVLRVGSFTHPRYGEFSVTPAMLQEMKRNFDNKVRGIDVAFDFFHDSDKVASGWPTALYLSEDGNSLWAKVDWTPNALKKLSERELRYFSPEFLFVWQDPESKVTYKNVLFGGGLTNRPFVKDMAAIVASEGKDEMTPEQIKMLSDLLLGVSSLREDFKAVKADVLKLSEGVAPAMTPEHKAASDELAATKKKLAEYMEANPPKAAPAAVPAPTEEDDEEGDEDDNDPVSLKKKLAESKKKLADMLGEKKLAELESEFTVMLTEGKACAAQKKAWMSQDMKAFAKLGGKVNLQGTGTAAGGNVDSSKDGRDERVIKLAEEKVKADPKMDFIDAMTAANREIPVA